MIRLCSTCGSEAIRRIKKSNVYRCLQPECGCITVDRGVQAEETNEYGERNGPVPNTTISTRRGIPYIDTITYIVDDPKSPDRRVVELPKPPDDRKKIDYHDLPKKDQYWRRPVTPWYWSDEFIDAIAESRWAEGTGKAAKVNYRWWSEDYDPKDTRWGPLTEAECRRAKAPKSAVGTFPYEEMVAYAFREWDRREHGYWFFNNGIATYLTGSNYYYLAHFLLEEAQPPEFRYMHWKIWNFVEYEVKADTKCLGFAHPKYRREGATGLALSDEQECASRERHYKAGIVSKTETDAMDALLRINTAKNNMVAFFRPLTSDLTKNPKKQIAYRSSQQRNKGISQSYSKDEESLNSGIETTATTNNPFDGKKKQKILFDEPGKITDANVASMWAVMKECLRQGPRRTGWAWVVSTVEELVKGGGQNFMELCWDSRQETENAALCSTSGLKRLFIPADEGLEGFIDIYGVSIREKPTAEQLAHLSERYPGMKGIEMGATEWIRIAHQGGSRERRKFPLTYMDCFIADTAGCVFDEQALIEQVQWLKSQPSGSAYASGSLHRVDGPDSRSGPVDFTHNPQGLWQFRFPPEFLDRHKNRVLKSGFTQERLYSPQNDQFIICVDPQEIGGKKTRDNSNTAIAVFWKHDPSIDPLSKPTSEWQSHSFIGFLCHRFRHVPDMWEEVAKACWFFGAKTDIERNKSHMLVAYLNEVGMHNFIADPVDGMKAENLTKDFVPQKPNEAKGTYMGGNQHGKSAYVMAGVIEKYIADHIRRMWHIPTLESWISFDPDDTEKSDQTIASGLCLLNATLRRSATSGMATSGVSLSFPKFDANTGSFV